MRERGWLGPFYQNGGFLISMWAFFFEKKITGAFGAIEDWNLS